MHITLLIKTLLRWRRRVWRLKTTTILEKAFTEEEMDIMEPDNGDR